MLQCLKARDQALQINGLNIACRAWGNENGQPVLAIHGWLDNCATFSRIAPRLGNYYIVAPDLAGHGQSEHRRNNSSYYLWDYAIDLAMLVQHFGWKRYSILAHSMGTGVASVLNAISGVVRSIVFLDGMGAPFTVKSNAVAEHIKRSCRMLDMAKKSRLYGFSNQSRPQFYNVESAIRDRQKSVGGKLSYESAELLAERDLIEVGSGYRWRHDPRLALPEPLQLSDEQAGSFLKNISCPLHTFLGLSGIFSGEKFKEKSTRLRPAVKIHWHEGGHHFHLENPSSELISQIDSALA